METISSKIYLIRETRVMLDRDLADLYGVKTKVLKQAVRSNITRFPYDRQFRVVFEAIKQLIDTEDKPRRKIGFEVK